MSKVNKSDSAIQKMPDEDQEVQAKAKNESSSTSQSSSTDGNSQTGDKTGMPSNLKSGLESLSGEDLSGVRVHRNSSKPDEIGAHAYAQGEDIYLGQGQEKHLPHEGWHVVQQKQGRVQPTIQQKSKLINDDAGLEKEADVMGAKAAQKTSHDTPIQAKTNRNATRNGVIQRAMKFEYQFYTNKLKLDNGSNVRTVPRKFGPRDYIVRDSSGARLESETRGQIEYETSWEKEWPKLKAQVEAVQSMSNEMQAEPLNELGSDGNMYRKFPAKWDITNLTANTGTTVGNDSPRWDRSQKDGDAIVKSGTEDFENFRSTPEYDKSNKSNPTGNFIREIKNGNNVFVHYTVSNGKWSRIEYKGELGWMVSSSLTGMESKSYEQRNEDGEGNKTDRPMKSGEKLLVDISDSNWGAYVQISESMAPEQYESFLSQHDSSRAKRLITDVDDLILKHNPQTAPSGETPSDKKIREDAFLNANNKLRNLLLMVIYYIEKGRTNSTISHGKPGSAKYALDVMSRTHLGSIFDTLTPDEQVLFTKLAKDKSGGILKSAGVSDTDLFFKDGTSEVRKGVPGYNPPVYKWLLSITTGNDDLSVRELSSIRKEYGEEGYLVPSALGKYKVDEEKKGGKHEGLIRMEARATQTVLLPLSDFVTHAENEFDLAIKNRPREQGKGKTGLEK